jgi:drug/metabolite transporter (DMT)-like permease
MFSLRSRNDDDTVHHTPQQDHVGRAIAWLLIGVTGGLGLDLCAKELLQTYSLQEFVLMRSVFGVVIFLSLASRLFGGFRMLQTRRWKWHLLRTVLASGAMFGFFYGLSKMPLVNALTLGFTAPLMMTALSVPFLGEYVGWRRWAAVVVGFIGTLIMLRPGSGDFTFASVAILIAAFCYACQAISARYLTTESMLSLSVYVVAGPMIIATGLMNGDNWLAPDRKGWLLFICAGICSVVAWVGFIKGYRGSSPAILAPFEYIALIGGATAGYLIWDEVPDRWVLAGAVTIIASGLYVVYREIGLRQVPDQDEKKRAGGPFST